MVVSPEYMKIKCANIILKVFILVCMIFVAVSIVIVAHCISCVADDLDKPIAGAAVNRESIVDTCSLTTNYLCLTCKQDRMPGAIGDQRSGPVKNFIVMVCRSKGECECVAGASSQEGSYFHKLLPPSFNITKKVECVTSCLPRDALDRKKFVCVPNTRCGSFY